VLRANVQEQLTCFGDPGVVSRGQWVGERNLATCSHAALVALAATRVVTACMGVSSFPSARQRRSSSWPQAASGRRERRCCGLPRSRSSRKPARPLMDPQTRPEAAGWPLGVRRQLARQRCWCGPGDDPAGGGKRKDHHKPEGRDSGWPGARLGRHKPSEPDPSSDRCGYIHSGALLVAHVARREGSRPGRVTAARVSTSRPRN
jgi:hypothetical protein